MAGALRRIQELFRRGELLTLTPPGGAPIFLWVNKLNSLENDEALKDARQARALRMIAWDRSEQEQAQFQVMVEGMATKDLAEDLLSRNSYEIRQKIEDDLRADPKWAERLEALDRQAIAAAPPGGRLDPQQAETLAALVIEWQSAVEKRLSAALKRELGDLKAKPRPELLEEFQSKWRLMIGATAFHEARRQTEIWYALHECEVQVGPDGQPDESTVKVGDLLCADREEVWHLPDEVIAECVRVLESQMTLRDAGNSGAPSASSGSSERQSAAEDSTPSTPTTTSQGPAGT